MFGFVKELLNSLFGWVDKPWKAVALVFFVLIAGFMFAGWSERPLLTEYFRRTFMEPRIDIATAENLLPVLATQGDIAVLWEVDPARNYQRVLMIQGGSELEREAMLNQVRPYLEPGYTPTDVIEQIEGETICIEQAHPYLGFDIAFVCAQKIPTNIPGILGLVHILWRETPGEADINRARVVLRFTSEKLTTW